MQYFIIIFIYYNNNISANKNVYIFNDDIANINNIVILFSKIVNLLKSFMYNSIIIQRIRWQY